MTNPAPRPALRKAEDASVHPAAPARSARAAARTADEEPARVAPVRRSRSAARPATVAEPTPSAAAEAGEQKAEPRRKDRGEVRTDRGRGSRAGKAPASTEKQRGRGSRAFAGATSDHLRPEAVAAAADTARKKNKQPWTDVDLMRGKTVDLEVRVPKRLRKAAKDEAKRRGLDLDAVTTELLHRWLTGR
jgi:hypothetical protein